MELGAFSVSLAVKDIATSRAFYELLGFEVVAGDMSHNYLILGNGSTRIGIFQGMFEGNILTFNPGWTQDCEPLATFTDVRAVQKHLVDHGIALQVEADPASTGPAHIVLHDPDGNVVMLDQHVGRPGV